MTRVSPRIFYSLILRLSYIVRRLNQIVYTEYMLYSILAD